MIINVNFNTIIVKKENITKNIKKKENKFATIVLLKVKCVDNTIRTENYKLTGRI